MIYDISYNDYRAYPCDSISSSISLVVPDYARIDENISEFLDAFATTDLFKIGKSYASIITSPKPKTAEARNALAGRLCTKNVLADNRVTTKPF